MQTHKFLSLDEVLELHDDQISSFGGTPGLRDEGLLESALAQPQATFGGQFLHPTIAEQAAAYLYHIAMNHPFIDGNKRSDECGDRYLLAFEWLLFEFDGRSSIRFSHGSRAGNDDKGRTKYRVRVMYC